MLPSAIGWTLNVIEALPSGNPLRELTADLFGTAGFMLSAPPALATAAANPALGTLSAAAVTGAYTQGRSLELAGFRETCRKKGRYLVGLETGQNGSGAALLAG